MQSKVNIVAFPLILPWRDEFWTLPLYFPDLKVGVIPGWPTQLPYRGLPLPKEAEVHPRELEHYKPGDLRQWQAFELFQKEQREEGDLIQAIRGYGQATPQAPSPPLPNAWTLAWQLEKMQADQDAQLLLVDKGHDWLHDVLKPERWDESASFGPVDGIEEMVDPELAQLRYNLWRRVLAPFLDHMSLPLLLGRTSRALFLTLKGWPDWTGVKMLRLSLPGCRNSEEWHTVTRDTGKPEWQDGFLKIFGALLTAMADSQNLPELLQELQVFIDEVIVAHWPFPVMWNWDLEIWMPDGPKDPQPTLCWGSASQGILPG